MKRSASRSELASPFVEFGSTDVQYLPADSICDLSQIRQHYDAEELRELADRIPLESTEEGIKFQLINPPTVAVFDEEGALRKYLDDHRRYYWLDVDAHDDIAADDDGLCRIRVNGHRRGRAIEMKCREAGIPLDQVMVASTILRNPSFDDARQKQYVENTSSPIKPAEDARALLHEYIWRWGVHPSAPIEAVVQRTRIKELSDFTGHSIDKVKAALTYVSMPEDIREFTKQGLSYSNVVALGRLRDAYANARDRHGTAQHTAMQAEQRMRDFFERVVLKRLGGTDKKSIGAAIDGKLREVASATSFVMDELFVFDEEAARRQSRQSTRKDIAKAAVLALKFAELDDDDVEKLLDILSPKMAERAVALSHETILADDLFAQDPIL